MRIICHQLLQGHSTKDGYAAPVLESRIDEKVNSPRSYQFTFGDTRREISDDKSTYVLEIEPTDDTFQRTVAICSQWKTTGTPSKYTHWLIPESGATDQTMRLLNRDYFMSGEEMASAYETPKVLTVKSIDLPDDKIRPEWQMTDQQKKVLGQFLSLYWISLAQNQPSKGIVGNRLPLVLRDTSSANLLKNEEAAAFFNAEIVSRLPVEAKEMVSAVFGVKWSEATTSFKKAVCVVLSTETGVPTEKKIDLVKGSHDLLSKFNHNDREAMNAIGQCLMAGEENYPEWYLRLRSLKNGIPKSAAPFLMYLSYLVRECENSTNTQINQASILENCYVGMYTKAFDGAAEANEIHEILTPLAHQIAERWLMQRHPSVEYFQSKRKWAINSAKLEPVQACKLLEPLSSLLLDEIESSQKLSEKEKISAVLQLLDSQEPLEDSIVISNITRFLSLHFEALLDVIIDNQEQIDSSDSNPININSKHFESALLLWNPAQVKGQPDDLIQRLKKVFAKFTDVAEESKHSKFVILGRLWIESTVDTLKQNERRGETPLVSQLQELAEYITLIGSSEESARASEIAMTYLQSHYIDWIMAEPVMIPEDDRFLSLAKKWINENLVQETADFSAEQMGRLETNLVRVFDAYHETQDGKNIILAVFRRMKGEAQLLELIDNPHPDNVTMAVKISDLHYTLREEVGVLSDDGELNRKFIEAMNPYFIAWSQTEPPFTSGSRGRYIDNWFVDVARDWLSQELLQQKLDSSSLEDLEKKLITTLKAYRVTEKDQRELLRELRLAWAEQKLNETIEKKELSSTEKAMVVSSIHDGLISEYPDEHLPSELEHALRSTIIDEFLGWQKATKPFMSTSAQKYSDIWFVEIASEWLQYNLDDVRLNSQQIEQLEKDLISAFSAFKASRDEQANMLVNLRRTWAEQKMNETLDDAALSDTAKALTLAGIHTALRRVSNAFAVDDSLELDLQRNLADLFLAWGKAEKPFASGDNLRYEDDWFVSVASDWLNTNSVLRELTSAEIDNLRKSLSVVYGYYHLRDQISTLLLPLWIQWGETKLQELQQMQHSSLVALEIAGIHNQLRMIPGALNEDNEEYLASAILDSFVSWGEAEKPFASSVNLRYEDDWFESIAFQWVENWMERESLSSSQLLALIKQLETACRAYRVKDTSSILKNLKRLYADTYVRENTGSTTENDAICKIAELLFKDRAISEDEVLSSTLVDYLAENFTHWACTVPPFCVGVNGTVTYVYGQEHVFLNILQQWQDHYLYEEESAETLLALKASIKTGFDTFRIPQRDLENNIVKLDYLIKRDSFDQLRNQATTPAILSRCAAIRVWIMLHKDQLVEAERVCTEIDQYLADNVDIWLDAEQPLMVDEYGYKAEFVISIVEKWIDHSLERRDRRFSQLQSTRKALDEARKELRLSTGRDISQSAQTKYHLFECRIFINEFTDQPMTNEQLVETAERLISISGLSDSLEAAFVDKLVVNIVQWLNVDPAFSCGNASVKSREELITRVVQEWIKQGCPAADLKIDDVLRITQILKPITLYSNQVEHADIHNKLEGLYLTLELQRIEAKVPGELTQDDCLKLAEIFAKTIENETLKTTNTAARDALIKNFGIWGIKCDFRLPHGLERFYASISLFDFVEAWVNQLPSDFSHLSDIREVEERLKKSATSLYRLGVSETRQLLSSIDEHCNWVIVSQLRNSTSVSLLEIDEALAAYTQLIKSGNESQTKLPLREELVRCFDKWIGSVPQGIDEAIVLDLANEWEEREFASLTFSDLTSLMLLKDSISKYFTFRNGDSDKRNRILCSLEVRWLHEAIRLFIYEQSSISSIAAVEARLAVYHGTLQSDDKLMQERFLLDHFVPWSKEGFRSEEGDMPFSYRGFVNLVKEWLQSSALADMSLESMDRIEDRLKDALTEGYGMSIDECKNLLKPIDNQKKQFIFIQARQTMSEDTLSQIFAMYQDDPEGFFNQIFDIVIRLAQKGDMIEQISSFASMQPDTWEHYKSAELHAGIISFLNRLYGLFDSGSRPIEIVEAMQDILRQMNFDISMYHDESENWKFIKGQLIDKRIKKFIRHAKSLDELPATWNSAFAGEYCTTWQEVLLRPAFEKELATRIEDEWCECHELEAKVMFIAGMVEYAQQSREYDYQKILMTIAHDYLHDNFQELYSSDRFREQLNSVLFMLQSNGIDVNAILNSETYQSGAFCQHYSELTINWNLKDAVSMLQQRPPYLPSADLVLNNPNHQLFASEQWLLLMLLCETTHVNDNRYWEPILNQKHIDLSHLNSIDLREVAATPFVEVMCEIYCVLSGNGIHWGTTDLKNYLKQAAPDLWKGLHPFSLFGGVTGIWRKIGGDKLQDNSPAVIAFRDWLLKGK